ncbi:hypothetical protein [uncultured Microbulbifer sp.]|uniref:hypothetical protein n=1 Tax=uncultured Microbulbifer sp. TaxID=348147 RepID=UPI00260453AE|nr:hypothetical protein [uncultured Microbulbifer sp.]
MRKTTTRRLTFASAFPLVLFSTLTLPTQAETVNEELQQCSQFSDDKKRLACFDKLAGSLQQHAEKQFGQEQKQVIEEAPDSITATVTSATKGAFGKYTFTLDNGQVWRQVESSSRNIWRGGEQITVERGALGSFIMRKATGGRSLRVKRVK